MIMTGMQKESRIAYYDSKTTVIDFQWFSSKRKIMPWNEMKYYKDFVS